MGILGPVRVALNTYQETWPSRSSFYPIYCIIYHGTGHRLDRVHQSSESGPPPPPLPNSPFWFRGGHIHLRKRGGGSKFGQGERHSGTLGNQPPVTMQFWRKVSTAGPKVLVLFPSRATLYNTKPPASYWDWAMCIWYLIWPLSKEVPGGRQVFF
jgi:hypothetical protein